MANPVCEVLITEAAINAPPVQVDSAVGAAADFLGIVRRLEDSREIEGIHYQAHREMAEHQLKCIGISACDLFGLEQVTIHHRIGFIAVGEPSLLVRVCSPHRQEAFRAIRWIVDELKSKVPIWKTPRFKVGASVAGAVDAGPGPGPSTPATTKATTI